jgi:hypothetical protein
VKAGYFNGKGAKEMNRADIIRQIEKAVSDTTEETRNLLNNFLEALREYTGSNTEKKKLYRSIRALDPKGREIASMMIVFLYL